MYEYYILNFSCKILGEIPFKCIWNKILNIFSKEYFECYIFKYF